MKFRDLTGQVFERLLATERDFSVKKKTNWICSCECGNKTSVFAPDLLSGRIKSCGCYRADMLAKRFSHGNCRNGKISPTYKSWANMLQRCSNPNWHAYRHYDGRGIAVCEEWHSFSVFLSEMGERPTGHSIERKDNNAGYSKQNCRWATRSEQISNRQNTISVTLDGQTKTLKQWCAVMNLNYTSVWYRIRRAGWTTELALKTPIEKRREIL